ncbi:hypothetical protein TSTA_111730 [Talaromyces stipitatus ATCC 10500]|uniref:Muramidase n=1 Tax=Talaromyces stipitatus (strain ATCC 10500 / CBS 375.48 / QM 6759 / NRRL 1006) TaxID=441959 RepID=B8M942_TALSN|nr:uncharacterized protein TSTA_111730 [Talaromyces stipitatus ATCC 10500]EED17337.1 hypothetical protein TSTA_111730 [Talaromyces stipitatus ATCC 10500]
MFAKAIASFMMLASCAFGAPGKNVQIGAPHELVSNPSGQKVTSSEAFTSGAGNRDNSNIYDGTGNAGTDQYNCYYGGWENFPPKSEWIEFDAMWNYSKSAMSTSCSDLGIGSCSNGAGAFGSGDSGQQIGMIWNAIQQVAESSLVDHRFILATILQESSGCVNVCATTNPDPSQPDNPGLMQSDGGSTFVGNSASNSAQQTSITQMVIDGTQGTADGDGLVQCINQYGNVYETQAARCYNSGSVDSSDLNNGEGATNSYVNDIANRLTGWLYSNSNFDNC